jgi:cell division protease FtsH
MGKYFRNIVVASVVTVIAVLVYGIWNLGTAPPFLSYTEFLESLEKGNIQRIHMKGGALRGVDVDGNRFVTYAPDVVNLVPKLVEKRVSITAEDDRPSMVSTAMLSVLPVLLLLAGWLIFRRMRGDKSSSFAQSQAKMFSKSGRRITFEDVAGIAEAKGELVEIIDFLKNSQKFSRLGGKIPKGVLLQGPPGTGKTLLAKAIAGEADVPFFSISGSDFVEMFVGVGASRVRDLFKQAKKKAPCIIFIDEIDAVGRHRGASSSTGGQDEREQTLNALLVEMDGFESKDTVILVAATNRPDVLDPALLRPGRFDRQVTISLPDVKGRLEILKVYMKNVITAKSVDLEDVARSTPGFSGAELANLVNEAALAAASQEKDAIDMRDFENAKDKVLMGLERKSIILNEEEKKATAYHEAGHALVATFLPETDPLHKLSIIPRGRALGVTQQLPLDDRYTYSKTYLINKIKTLMGGRVAEEIVFNQYTTGATNDLLSATEIATKMVCEWGMNDTIGPLAYLRENESFLGGSGTYRHFSEETAQAIDREIKGLIDQCYRETVALLKERIAMLHKLAEVLLIHETIDAYEVGLITQCRLLNQGAGEGKEALQEVGGKVAEESSTLESVAAR